MSRHLLKISVVAFAMITVIGCGSGNGSSKGSPTPTPSSSPSSSATMPASSTSPPSTAPIAACSTVTTAFLQSKGAAGTIYQPVSVTNTGTASCTLQGYPSLLLLSSTHSPIATTDTDASGPNSVYAAYGTFPTSVTLPAGSTAAFIFSYSHVSATTCSSPASVEVTMPGSSASTTDAFSDMLCGGNVNISPFKLGISWVSP